MFATEIDFRAAIGTNTRGKNKIGGVLGDSHFIGLSTRCSYCTNFSLLYTQCRQDSIRGQIEIFLTKLFNLLYSAIGVLFVVLHVSIKFKCV